ncbi:Rad1 single-stranded DNA endonuclease [Candida orthopsilosis Co 90-125]|uniref:Rad1 single-stranded DNA endonuclease n=1 Tax=Candida orthopsilosis (strain 90-125) TaxID=1136231 RepID=H8X3U6_CANO9|nr:Rad1 single-stranded DNA endonuclease [Candida orthopsilosis Co 90-125]CCG25734.1 Rad1 single-stranded DNA endonuclease [Candida orthopsilosis Co 90-125]
MIIADKVDGAILLYTSPFNYLKEKESDGSLLSQLTKNVANTITKKTGLVQELSETLVWLSSSLFNISKALTESSNGTSSIQKGHVDIKISLYCTKSILLY